MVCCAARGRHNTTQHRRRKSACGSVFASMSAPNTSPMGVRRAGQHARLLGGFGDEVGLKRAALLVGHKVGAVLEPIGTRKDINTMARKGTQAQSHERTEAEWQIARALCTLMCLVTFCALRAVIMSPLAQWPRWRCSCAWACPTSRIPPGIVPCLGAVGEHVAHVRYGAWPTRLMSAPSKRAHTDRGPVPHPGMAPQRWPQLHVEPHRPTTASLGANGNRRGSAFLRTSA